MRDRVVDVGLETRVGIRALVDVAEIKLDRGTHGRYERAEGNGCKERQGKGRDRQGILESRRAKHRRVGLSLARLVLTLGDQCRARTQQAVAQPVHHRLFKAEMDRHGNQRRRREQRDDQCGRRWRTERVGVAENRAQQAVDDVRVDQIKNVGRLARSGTAGGCGWRGRRPAPPGSCRSPGRTPARPR